MYYTPGVPTPRFDSRPQARHVTPIFAANQGALAAMASTEEEEKRAEASAEERNIQMFKMRKLVLALERARGNGTSMISLILPPRSAVRASVARRGAASVLHVYVRVCVRARALASADCACDEAADGRVRHRVEHQVPREPALCTLGDHVHAAAAEAVHARAPERSRIVLWHNDDGRRQREEGARAAGVAVRDDLWRACCDHCCRSISTSNRSSPSTRRCTCATASFTRKR